ncbi:hypothetical protein K438DRAFT_1981205 [Mycena galopus ATCC 62051]|nr:hypothetical protein K438DRAFT_1981205 [Mycena galopus ATCC 62051]
MLSEDTAQSREASPQLEAGGGRGPEREVERPQQSSRRRDCGRRRTSASSHPSRPPPPSKSQSQPPPAPALQQQPGGEGQKKEGLKLRVDLNLVVDMQIKLSPLLQLRLRFSAFFIP